MKFWLRSVFVAILGVLIASTGIAEEAAGIDTRAEVDAALAQLDDAKTRLDALERLIPFASIQLYRSGGIFGSTGDAEKDALIGEVVAAIAKHHDFKTLGGALNSSSATLQFWALRYIPSFDEGPWRPLLPRLRELALSGDSLVRGEAQNRLFSLEGQRAFLVKCLEEETVPNHIMSLLRHFDRSTYRQRMNSRVLALLRHEDAKVRRLALFCVGFNSNRAPMWQFSFGRQVLAETLRLSRSSSAKERGSAAYALNDLRQRYPDAVRKRMLELVEDPSADVRWRIPSALRDQIERPEVQAAMDRLLSDASPLVQYFTILALGPEKHVEQLRRLASGSDKQAAEFATGKLKQLARKEE